MQKLVLLPSQYDFDFNCPDFILFYIRYSLIIYTVGAGLNNNLFMANKHNNEINIINFVNLISVVVYRNYYFLCRVLKYFVFK